MRADEWVQITSHITSHISADQMRSSRRSKEEEKNNNNNNTVTLIKMRALGCNFFEIVQRRDRMLLVSDVMWNVVSSMLSYCHDRKTEESRDSSHGDATLLFLPSCIFLCSFPLAATIAWWWLFLNRKRFSLCTCTRFFFLCVEVVTRLMAWLHLINTDTVTLTRKWSTKETGYVVLLKENNQWLGGVMTWRGSVLFLSPNLTRIIFIPLYLH